MHQQDFQLRAGAPIEENARARNRRHIGAPLAAARSKRNGTGRKLFLFRLAAASLRDHGWFGDSEIIKER
jgi:hypothetical protein